jgi:hypothetical protein
LCLPTRIFEEPVLGFSDEARTESAFGAQAKTGITAMGDPPLKSGT